MNGATSSPVFGPIFLFKGIFAQVYYLYLTYANDILWYSLYNVLVELLIQCAQYMPGQFQCDNYLRPVFTLTSFELVQRTFAILSCILLGIALIMMLIGMETSKIFLREENVHIKMKLMKGPAFRFSYRGWLLRFEETWSEFMSNALQGASVLIFAAAFMLLYNASTFAAQISNEFFYNQFYTETGIGSRVSLALKK